MRLRNGLPVFFVLLLGLGGPHAAAQEPVEGILKLLQRVRSASGEFPPTIPRFFGWGVTDRWVGVTIRLTAPPSAMQLDELQETIGRPMPRLSGRRIVFHRGTVAEVPWERLAAVAALPFVERIDIGRRPGMAHPMDLSIPEVEADEMWEVVDTLGSRVTGAVDQDRDGVVDRRLIVADIDSGIDVFHPMFFHLDPTVRLPFSDVDFDGEFTPGIDTVVLHVDFDGDGVEEDMAVTLSLQDGLRVMGGGNEGNDGIFNPSTDWLYWDRNGNGRRDFGIADGYGEGDPTYGEPLFVGDEMSASAGSELLPNDRLDVGELLVPLGDSKIRAVMEPVVHVLERGDLEGNGLVDNRMLDQSHGTGVASILLGAWPGIGRRFVGAAPGAELVLATTDASSFPVGAGLPFALDQGADVVLYEFGYLVTSFLDGSTNDEQLISDATAAGVPQIVPTGNWGNSGKTVRVPIQEGATEVVPARVPETRSGSGVSGISLVHATFRWRESEAPISVEIGVPGKGVYEVVPGDETSHDDIRVVAEFEVSDRGTAKLDVMIIGLGETVPVGEDWTFTLRNDSDVSIEVWGGVADDRSTFSGGFTFTGDFTDSLISLAGPATADRAIAVGSYSTRDSGGGRDQGRLSGFSGRGTRIDGVRILDVAAPGDYDVFWARSWGPSRAHWGYYTGFGGGTSAAGPHVAGAVALLAQMAPWAGSEEIEHAIQFGALGDEWVGEAPNDIWGFGKLRVHASVPFLPEPRVTDPEDVYLWGLNLPYDVVSPGDGGTGPDGTGARRFTARGGWSCGLPGDPAPIGGLLLAIAFVLSRRRAR